MTYYESLMANLSELADYADRWTKEAVKLREELREKAKLEVANGQKTRSNKNHSQASSKR